MSSGETAPPPNGWLGAGIALVGKGVAWLSLLMVLLTFGIVVLRYGFNLGWIWLQESVTYLHAMVFMLAAAWTWQIDEHVRVDIFYREHTPRQKALVNLVGCLLFLVPVCVFLIMMSWRYVGAAWNSMEGSREAGGLPLVYLQKTLILVLPVMLLAQAVETIRGCIRTLAQKSG